MYLDGETQEFMRLNEGATDIEPKVQTTICFSGRRICKFHHYHFCSKMYYTYTLLLQIQFTPTSARDLFDNSDSNSMSDQPAIFTVHPTASTYAEAVFTFVSQFGWRRLLVITDTQDGEMFFISVSCYDFNSTNHT